MRINKCSGCGFNFGSMGAFEKHRIGDYGGPIYDEDEKQKVIGRRKPTRRCMTTEEMEKAGMVQSLETLNITIEGQAAKQQFVTWTIPLTEEQKAALAKLRHNAD